MKRRFAIVIVAALLILGASLFAFSVVTLVAQADPCSQSNREKCADELDRLARKFFDGAKLANSTPRVSLGPMVADLQATRRDTEDLKVPACAESSKMTLVDYMNAAIEGYRLFMAQETDTKVNATFDEAIKNLESYRAAVAELKAKR
jgi:hypothetical protein